MEAASKPQAGAQRWGQALVEYFEPEYDPDKLPDDELPIFDVSGRSF